MNCQLAYQVVRVWNKVPLNYWDILSLAHKTQNSLPANINLNELLVRLYNIVYCAEGNIMQVHVICNYNRTKLCRSPVQSHQCKLSVVFLLYSINWYVSNTTLGFTIMKHSQNMMTIIANSLLHFIGHNILSTYSVYNKGSSSSQFLICPATVYCHSIGRWL